MTAPLIYDLTLAPGNDWDYGFTIQTAPNAFAALVAAAGLNNVTAFFAQTDAEAANGAPVPIDASLEVTAVEVSTGNYNVAFAGVDTLAHLADFYDQVVYLCIQIGTQCWATLRVKIVRSLAL